MAEHPEIVGAERVTLTMIARKFAQDGLPFDQRLLQPEYRVLLDYVMRDKRHHVKDFFDLITDKRAGRLLPHEVVVEPARRPKAKGKRKRAKKQAKRPDALTFWVVANAVVLEQWEHDAGFIWEKLVAANWQYRREHGRFAKDRDARTTGSARARASGAMRSLA